MRGRRNPPSPSILLPSVSEADFVTIRAPESGAQWVGVPLLSYVAAAQHVAGLTIKMNSDQQPQRNSAPNPSVNRPISSSLPIIVAVVHRMYKTRDMSCIPRIPARHEPDEVCVQITSGQHVRETVVSCHGRPPAPRSARSVHTGLTNRS
jgi:hypothetical protein